METPTKTTKLYQGKIIIDFYGPTEDKPKRHIYKLRKDENDKGRRPLSVTAVTGKLDKSRQLVIWATGLAKDYLCIRLEKGITEKDILEAVDQHNRVKSAAATIGSTVHEWAEKYIKTKIKDRKDLTLPEDPKAANGAIAFLKWVEEHKIKFLDSEKLIYSKKHDYVGLMDCKFTMGSEKHKIIHAGDFKTSKAIYNDYRYQVAGYQAADEEESGEVYGTKWLIRFGKEDGEFEAHEYGEHDKDFKAFLGLLAVAKREKELTVYAPF